MSLIIEPLIAVANISTVLLSAFNKVPQIVSVVRARSAASLSIYSVLLELTGYCITMSYFIAYQYALGSYLEYPFLVIQDVCLVTAVLVLSNQIGGMAVAGYFAALVALVSAMTTGLISAPVMTILVSTSTPISAVSKLVQLAAIVRKRSSEGIAVSSWLISAYTCFTRIITVYIATADAALLTNFGISLFLNCTIILATLFYAPPLGSKSAAAAKANLKKQKKNK